jgi:7-cyano-7-deazaguanine synthase
MHYHNTDSPTVKQMQAELFPKKAVLSLSGGMDSSTLLLHLLNAGYDVTALSFDYGQKHRVELNRASDLVRYLNGHALEQNPGKRMFYPIKHQVIKLDGLSDLLNSNLVSGGEDVPEGHYAEDNMKATVVPNRNKIFSSLIQSVALSIANENNCPVKIALGIHAGDHAIYPDCRQEFRDADYEAFLVGNWDSDKVTYSTPYLEGDKFTILEDGLACCENLGLDFDTVYSLTNTSYKPFPSGNSDYKSASSIERIEAFIKLGRPDPVQYEDETGPVSWDVAKAHAEEVLAGYAG